MPKAVSRITSERVDDLPVIVHWLLQMNLPALIDQHLPRPHGNRQGLSYGQLSVLVLAYIVSQADHRLCAVEPWVRQHHKTLEWTTGWQIGEKDASDDRLADLIEVIGIHNEIGKTPILSSTIAGLNAIWLSVPMLCNSVNFKDYTNACIGLNKLSPS